MITKITSVQKLKDIFIENFVAKTDKVTKVSDGSVMNAIAYGIAKIAQKFSKDIALVESHIYPATAFGVYLDNVAKNHGIPARLGPAKSSTYIRLKAAPGTQYVAGNQIFTGSHGIVFDLEEDVTVGDAGYAYAKIRSQQNGQKANVPALSINQVAPSPAGHIACANEYASQYGRDNESDDMLRSRIQNIINLASSGTLEKVKQSMLLSNPDVLRVFYHGVNEKGQNVLAVASQSGVDFSDAELSAMVTQISDVLALTDLRPFGDTTSPIEVRNVSWGYVDISFRARLASDASVSEVRKNIQIAIGKYLDFRKWDAKNKVEWDELLEIVKSQNGVEYVPDKFFFPNSDIEVGKTFLPRLRGFIMKDLDGGVIVDTNNAIPPTFYANDSSAQFQQVILRN